MTFLLVATAASVTLLSAVSAAWASQIALTILAAAACVIVAKSQSWEIPAASLWMGATACLGILQIVVSGTADFSSTGGETVEWLVLAIVMATAASAFHSSIERHRFLVLFAAVAGIIAAFANVQPFAGRFGLDRLAAATDQMVGPFRNRNTYAAFVELAFPVAVWAARRVGPEWWLAAATLLGSALATGSRAGAAIVLGEALVMAVWFQSRARVLTLVAVVAVSLLLGGDTLRTRIGYRDPLEHRREIFASSLELASERPFMGWGLGAFQKVYPAQARFDVGAYVNHAHNDWLESAAEGGLPYAAALAAGAALILWYSRRSIWALGLPAVLVHSFVDFPFQRTGVTVWFMLLAGAAYAQQESCKPSRN